MLRPSFEVRGTNTFAEDRVQAVHRRVALVRKLVRARWWSVSGGPVQAAIVIAAAHYVGNVPPRRCGPGGGAPSHNAHSGVFERSESLATTLPAPPLSGRGVTHGMANERSADLYLLGRRLSTPRPEAGRGEAGQGSILIKGVTFSSRRGSAPPPGAGRRSDRHTGESVPAPPL